MSSKPSETISLVLVPRSSPTVPVADDEVTENSTPSKTKSTTENESVRDIPLLADAAVNHPSEQFNLEEAKGNGVIPSPPTGNINLGPGPGAYNMGKRAAAISVDGKDVSFKQNEDASKESVPSGGNLNRGPGAGAVNWGEETATIHVKDGTVFF